MNRFRILQTLPLLAALVLLAAGCTQNELGNEQGEPLPEGMYPIEFTATGLQATPQTCDNTADGFWGGGENVAIQIGRDVKQYKPESIGSTTTLIPDNKNNKFYWQSTDDVTVQAWYCGTGYDTTLSTSSSSSPWTWTVQSDQSGINDTDGYQQSDFLYAKDNFEFKTSNTLHFFHQTAKVVVHIIEGSQTPA